MMFLIASIIFFIPVILLPCRKDRPKWHKVYSYSEVVKSDGVEKKIEIEEFSRELPKKDKDVKVKKYKASREKK